jgi:hypothetical protein
MFLIGSKILSFAIMICLGIHEIAVRSDGVSRQFLCRGPGSVPT